MFSRREQLNGLWYCLKIILAPSIRHPVLKAQPIKVSEFLDYVNTRQANISAYKSEFDVGPRSHISSEKSSNV